MTWVLSLFVTLSFIFFCCCCSAAHSRPTLCDSVDCSTLGFPVHHEVCSNSWPLSQWCHPTISSSVIPVCLQSFPASGSFLMSRSFTSCGQSIGVSASASESVLPMNIQDWLEWTGLISLQSKGLSRVLQHHSSKASILRSSTFLMVQLSHPYVTTGKTVA